eukprot:1179814-Prorocentrum_minimum.AAC.2
MTEDDIPPQECCVLLGASEGRRGAVHSNHLPCPPQRRVQCEAARVAAQVQHPRTPRQLQQSTGGKRPAPAPSAGEGGKRNALLLRTTVTLLLHFCHTPAGRARGCRAGRSKSPSSVTLMLHFRYTHLPDVRAAVTLVAVEARLLLHLCYTYVTLPLHTPAGRACGCRAGRSKSPSSITLMLHFCYTSVTHLLDVRLSRWSQ